MSIARLPIAFIIALLFGIARFAAAGPQFAVALQGYDAVSYFDDAAPAPGSVDHTVYWNGVTWLFSNEANANRFLEHPERYAPQFDGYCALAASLGYKAPADPLTGKVVRGRLYVNFNAEATRIWSEDIPGNIRKAEENWPRLNAL